MVYSLTGHFGDWNLEREDEYWYNGIQLFLLGSVITLPLDCIIVPLQVPLLCYQRIQKVRRLNKLKNKTKGNKFNETCSICLEETTDYKTKCGHYFHECCLCQWKISKSNCPLCRTSL